MAWQADCWDRLAQQDRRNHAMRKMTGFAVFFLDRLMYKSDFESCNFVRMAFGAGASNLRFAFCWGWRAAYHKHQNPQADDTESR